MSTASRGTTYAIDAETGQEQWTSPRRRNAALEPGDRRPARHRQLTGRNRHGPRPRDGSSLWQVRDRGESRVVPGRRRGARRTSGRTTAGCSRCARRRDSVRWAYQTRRPHQREPVGVRRPRVRHHVCGVVRLPRPQDGRGAVDHLRQARRLPLRELLREPVVRRRAPLLGRALGQGRTRSTRRAETPCGRARRRPRLHDSRRRRRDGSSSADSTGACARSGRPRATSSGAPRSEEGSSARRS